MLVNTVLRGLSAYCLYEMPTFKDFPPKRNGFRTSPKGAPHFFKIAAKVPGCTVDMEVMFEVDYLLKVHELTKQNCMLMYHKQTHLVLRNGEVVGNAKAFVEMAMKEYDVVDAEAANVVIYNRFVRELTAKMMKERGRPIVYIEFVDAGSKPSDAVRLGVMQIELFSELCPQAAENFTKLCMGMGSGANAVHYKGCPIHRLVKDGWIQCGDMVDGSGAHSTAALDQTNVVPDESFTLDFGFIPGGVVGFANEGAHSSGSQFFITMGPCEWMNHNFVGVGRVLQGFHILRTLNQLATANQRPIKNITVLSCGITPIE